MRPMLRLMVLMGLSSCTHAPEPVKSAPPPPPLTGAAAVRAQLAAAYDALASGDAEALGPLFTEDALVFGLGPSDTWEQRDTFLERLAQALMPLTIAGDTLALAASSPVVGLAPDGRSAWVYDLPRVALTRHGSTTSWLPRLTAHAVLEDGEWRFDALHASLGVADELVFSPDAARRLLPPADVSGRRGAESEQLVGLTRRLLGDFGVKLDRTTDRDEFVQVGQAPSEVFERGTRFKQLVRPQLPAIRKAGYGWTVDGPLRTQLAPGGRTGWAAGNVVLRIGTGKKQQVLPPFRTLWIYVEEDGVWNLASEHQSLAVREELRESATDAELAAWEAARAANARVGVHGGATSGADAGQSEEAAPTEAR